MGESIATVLEGWLDILGRVETAVRDVSTAAEVLVAHLKTVPAKAKAIKEKICLKDSCAGPVISSFLAEGKLFRVCLLAAAFDPTHAPRLQGRI